MQTFTQDFAKLPFKASLYFSLGISMLTILIVFTLFKFLPPEVPLFYGKPVGEGQLTKTLGLIIVPAASLVILGANTLFAILTKDIFIKKILIGGALIASLLGAITIVKIIFLVGFF